VHIGQCLFFALTADNIDSKHNVDGVAQRAAVDKTAAQL
jgi:hypothetical protein